MVCEWTGVLPPPRLSAPGVSPAEPSPASPQREVVGLGCHLRRRNPTVPADLRAARVVSGLWSVINMENQFVLLAGLPGDSDSFILKDQTSPWQSEGFARICRSNRIKSHSQRDEHVPLRPPARGLHSNGSPRTAPCVVLRGADTGPRDATGTLQPWPWVLQGKVSRCPGCSVIVLNRILKRPRASPEHIHSCWGTSPKGTVRSLPQ